MGNLQPTEKRIYERLDRHPYILRYYGEYSQGNGLPNGLVFQYQRAGTLMDNLALSKYPEKRTQWPVQAAEALRFIHTKNVIHSDFGCHNFLIQKDGSLALADFGGSRIDNISAAVSYPTRYARPCSDDSVSTEIDDLFALGMIIYEISVKHLLYADRPSREIRKSLHQHEFPDLDTVTPNLQVVIRKCWSNGYQTAEEVIRDLEATPSPSYPHLFCFTGLFLGIVITVFIIIRRRSF
ncbi:kinase-like protein [Aspergillus sclerotioniger CBS 115572]|uniref:Kinase-like protein n=1 Tax=Aspergillus sclerotioniger CBS 115572 TaxID=1450535 RepID=A0A317WZM9_9EURO|nr:kinase-like protein [Aspergillus sclerotioniger CBS 115572]PWY91803.1 kinase-like protein [Aspergillus sclerotioniger CBS 115572]